MKNLGIDSGKVNMFTFEQFREHQLKLAFESQNLLGANHTISSSVVPLDTSNSYLTSQIELN